jgi:hypothetical protein
MQPWSEFGIRHLGPPMSTRRQEEIPPPLEGIVKERTDRLIEPLRGITTDGTVRPGLFPLSGPGATTAPVTEAAQAFLQALTSEQRDRATFPLEAEEWRTWINVHMNFFRHGVMLEDLPTGTRELGLDLLRATLSTRGFDQARDIMRVNELIAELSGTPDSYGEWPYFISIFGDPSGDGPWGWQIDGHHLNVNCVIVDDHLVTTPTFMGAEPRTIGEGPYAGIDLFRPEEAGGLALIRSLDQTQTAKAIVLPSLHPDDLPSELQHPFDGRMEAGAFHDNAVIPEIGVPATDLSDAQRMLLQTLIGTYVGWETEAHAQIRMDAVTANLDETWFGWYGGTGDDDPFYYRVNNPVVLIEFDHHPGVVFDNDVPSHHHVHTVVRTPNGGDYGTDLLRQHHDRYDHSHGHHRHRG